MRQRLYHIAARYSVKVFRSLWKFLCLAEVRRRLGCLSFGIRPRSALAEIAALLWDFGPIASTDCTMVTLDRCHPMESLSAADLGTATFGQHALVQQTYRSLFSQVCSGALSAFERLPRTGRRWDLTSLLSVAEQQTGLNDFGDDRFLEPMAFLLESIEREAKLNALGRFVFYQHTIQLLRNRLYLERESRIDRRISSRKITKPVCRAPARHCCTAYSLKTRNCLRPLQLGK
jgi:hypothetical protein